MFIAYGMMSSAMLCHSVIALNNDLGWLIRTPRYGWGLFVQLCLASFCHSLKWPWPPGHTQSLSKIHRNAYMQLKMYVVILVHSIIRLILIIAHISWMHSNLNTPTSMQTHTHTRWTFLNVFVGHALNNLPIPLAYSPCSYSLFSPSLLSPPFFVFSPSMPLLNPVGACVAGCVAN